MIYFISDTHFNHNNIIEYCSRPYENVLMMNEELIKNWNEVINDNDEIYHLGDLALGRRENITDILNRLNGKKYLIRGNHDSWNRKFYKESGFEVLRNPPIKLEEHKLILSHKPISDKEIPKDFTNIHGHIHDKKLEECIESYPTELYTKEKHINVSCDVINFKPISIIELKKEMNK